MCVFHPLTSYRLKCKHTNEAGLICTEKMVGSKALRFEAWKEKRKVVIMHLSATTEH